MASASAFGFSGWDPLGSYGEGLMGLHFNKEMMEQQYKYAQKSLRESPSAYRAGLEKAGYNPLLALSNGFSPPTSFAGGSIPLGEGTVNGFDAEKFASSKAAVSTQKAQKRTVEATADNAEAQAEKTAAEATGQKIRNVTDSLGTVAKLGVSAYTGKKLGDIATALKNGGKGGAVARSVFDTLGKSGANKATLSIGSMLLPLAGYGAGIGSSAFLGKKMIDNAKELKKKHNIDWRGPSPLLMGH